MTGQELYEFYAALHLVKHACEVDGWKDLDQMEIEVWNDMAVMLAPELSDQAKQILEAL